MTDSRLTDSQRVVVTGLGLISPVGNTVTEGWNNVRDGVSGITPIEWCVRSRTASAR